MAPHAVDVSTLDQRRYPNAFLSIIGHERAEAYERTAFFSEKGI